MEAREVKREPRDVAHASESCSNGFPSLAWLDFQPGLACTRRVGSLRVLGPPSRWTRPFGQTSAGEPPLWHHPLITSTPQGWGEVVLVMRGPARKGFGEEGELKAGG